MKLSFNPAIFQQIYTSCTALSRPQKLLACAVIAFSSSALLFGASRLLRNVQHQPKETQVTTAPIKPEPPNVLPLPPPPEKDFKERVFELCKPVVEDPDFYMSELDSVKEEIIAIEQRMQLPSVQKLVQSIKGTQEESIRVGQRAVLLVVLGIKPALALYNQKELDTLNVASIIEDIRKDCPEVAIVTGGEYRYVVNEKPLAIFDPRSYLINFDVSIAKEVVRCFPNQNQVATDQRLSYLLGFGPSWEPLVTNGATYRLKTDSEYSNAHFQQIGSVIAQKEEDPLLLGKQYHDQFDTIIKRALLGPQQKNCESIEKILDETGTAQIYDGITMRTTYFKQSCCLKLHVLQATLKAE